MENIQTPIGTTPMETRVLKEPRGFMRILQFFFAIFAFATCCNYTNRLEYDITCVSAPNTVIKVIHNATYPFNLDHESVLFSCPNDSRLKPTNLAPLDNFRSDAEFFVFTGVISFLSTLGCLIVYVFFSDLYSAENKQAPMIDFCFTVVIAVFWLSASAAWANGLTGIKYDLGGQWIYSTNDHPCFKTSSGSFASTSIKTCDILEEATGSFAGATISVLLGFLNFFLWSSNLWFLYKETSMFSTQSGATQLEG